MMNHNLLSKRVNRIKPSPTISVAARAMELQAQGQDVISLSLGEPDFNTPELIQQAAIQAMREGWTRYTAVDGLDRLKQAIVAKFKRENQLEYQTKEVLVSCGAKHSLYNLFQALLNPGDQVLIPAPYWVSYLDMALLADADPFVVQADIQQHFKITPQQLQASINSRTKLFILNSPSNPSGIAYTEDELKDLAEVLLKHPQVWIVSDDIYEHILWNAPQGFKNILNVCPELKERSILINGVSKAYAMTGWRIGYAAGPRPVIAAMSKIQSQSTSNANSIAQVAAAAALDGDQSSVLEMNAIFQRRHQLMYQSLNDIPGFQCLPSDGTFYSFPCVQEAMARCSIDNDIDFSEFLLNKAQVAVVPGSAFGLEGYLRISFASSEEQISQALDRLATLFKG